MPNAWVPNVGVVVPTASRIKLRLHFSFAHVYLETFLLQCSSTTLRILRETNRCFVKLVSERHGSHRRRITRRQAKAWLNLLFGQNMGNQIGKADGWNKFDLRQGPVLIGVDYIAVVPRRLGSPGNPTRVSGGSLGPRGRCVCPWGRPNNAHR
jgi:hypothetical protein